MSGRWGRASGKKLLICRGGFTIAKEVIFRHEIFMKQVIVLIFTALFSLSALAQSGSENFPTPVVQNRINGKIPARDIGDARLTRHFYTFFADNGDVSLEIETANFDGDIDLFERNTLRPLAKITIVAETEPSKTRRIIYFRKREQIILRIEGRSLTDEAASYQLAFTGSFAAAFDLPQPPVDVEPKVADKSSDEATAKVNSAGAIIEVPTPEPAAEPEPITLKIKPPKTPTVARRRTTSQRSRIPVSKTESAPAESDEAIENAPEIAAGKLPKSAEESLPEPSATKSPKPKSKPTGASRNKPVRTATAKKSVAKKPVPISDETTSAPEPDPLANVQLVILLKNGDRVERQMSEVFNVSVDKGQITVITKSGKIERYNLLDVQQMKIE